MPEQFSKEERSAIMGRVKSKNTKPEMVVRRLLHGLGYRYRLHGKELPGKPDLVFKRRKKAIFVHGCFWHMHPGCSRSKIPEKNREYWERKLHRNRERDRENLEALKGAGWEVHIVWGCELRDKEELARRLSAFLGPTRVS